jgi:hypothetical protein
LSVNEETIAYAEDGAPIIVNATVSKPVPIIGEVYSDRRKIADSFSKL